MGAVWVQTLGSKLNFSPRFAALLRIYSLETAHRRRLSIEPENYQKCSPQCRMTECLRPSARFSSARLARRARGVCLPSLRVGAGWGVLGGVGWGEGLEGLEGLESCWLEVRVGSG